MRTPPVLNGILHYGDRFFFRNVTASGFGLMRIAWAATVLLVFIGTAGDIVRYYSDIGIVPPEIGYSVFRSEYRFTLLDVFGDPTAVVALWSLFMLCTFFMMIGLWPRLMTTISVLMLFSFHERNLQPLGGGDTVLRSLGFILLVAPEISAFSLSRLELQWQHWKQKGELLPKLKMHIWPYRLVLWQVMIIYITSGWDKLQGTMWQGGTVLDAVFHHTHFVRYSLETMNQWVWMSPFVSLYVLTFEFTWLLLLIPKDMWSVLPLWIRRHSLKRWLIIGGLLLHWGIFTFMSVGSFPYAMTVAFIGLLLDEDFTVLKKLYPVSNIQSPISILYDGNCNLCRRSIFALQLLDFLDRLQFVDFRKNPMGIAEEDLDRAMHVVSGDRVWKGFDGFRAITWHLPALLWMSPLLYISGVAPIGRKIYAQIAARRNRCADGVCKHTSK